MLWMIKTTESTTSSFGAERLLEEDWESYDWSAKLHLIIHITK